MCKGKATNNYDPFLKRLWPPFNRFIISNNFVATHKLIIIILQLYEFMSAHECFLFEIQTVNPNDLEKIRKLSNARSVYY